MTTTVAQRSAGTALLVLGGFNVVVGTLGLLGGGASAFGFAAFVGVVFAALGLNVRRGARQAIIVAAVLLGLLLAWQLVQLVLDPGMQLAVRVLLTGAVGALVLRAHRGA